MVTEMEWKCCNGYSGEDCAIGPAGGTQVSTTRPAHGRGASYGQGAGNSGSVLSGGNNSEFIICNINSTNWFLFSLGFSCHKWERNRK